jgi:hypothetical protein
MINIFIIQEEIDQYRQTALDKMHSAVSDSQVIEASGYFEGVNDLATAIERILDDLK